VALAVANNPDVGNRPISEFMSKDIVSVAPDASLQEVAAKFAQHELHRLLVVDSDGQLRGIIAWADIAPHVPDASLGRVVSDVVEAP
jgi:Mg/Co/Ni transporter MgtE